MVKKFDVITKLYEEATQEVTESPEKWIAFLQSASKNYRLPFDEQLLIHVQRPEATAVLPMEKWNEKFGRWVKRDSKGIAVFDKSSDRLKLKYYFDVSDTREGKYKRLVRPVSLWSVAEEQQEPVKEALVNTFGVTDGDRKEFAMVILEASLNIAEDNIGDYLPDILLATKDSPLEEIDEFNIRLKMKQLLANSISYMLFLRCGIEPDIYLETRDFQNIRDFHTKELVNLFGVAASDMSEMALGEVADTIRKLKIQERKQRTFVEQKTTDYNVDNKQEIATERGQDNGSNHIQQTGRLSPAESYNSRGRGSSPWEVRISPKTISDEESVRNVSESSDSGNIEPASDSDGGRSTEQNGDTYSADGRERGRDRRTESQRSDGVDRENEQYPAESAGNREERNPGELEENNRSSDILPSEEEQLQILEEKAEEKSPAFSFSQELIDEVLQDGPHFADGKYDIYSYLKQEHSTSENVKFLQGAYGIGGRTLNINGIKLDENYDSKGIKLRKGYEVDSPEILLKWNVVVKRVGELIAVGRYLSEQEQKEFPEYEKRKIARGRPLQEESEQQLISDRAVTESENESADYDISEDTVVTIGMKDYEVEFLSAERVVLRDQQYPIFSEELSREEFDRKICENPANDHLKIKRPLPELPAEEEKEAQPTDVPSEETETELSIPEQNYQFVMKMAGEVLRGEVDSKTFEAGAGFMPLTIEQVGDNFIAISHYYEQNGDSQFERIPLSIERQQRTIRSQIEELVQGITEEKARNGNKFTIKQLEKTKKSLLVRLEKLNDQSKKDQVINFEELGIDRLFVDEADGYKNLYLYTKMRNIAGIAQTEALKSSDMFMKCQYLDELTGGKGVVFATGTPVSNSMVELYTMQRYLQHHTLVEHNLQHFDAWASTFGETVTAIELAPEGTGYRLKTRFAKFYNLPELMQMFREVADIQTADMLNLPVPEVEYRVVSVKPSEMQRDMVAELGERAERVRDGMVNATEDNMLLITNDGRKLALDQRMMNELLPDYPESKVNACVEEVYNFWEQGQEKRLTQLVFCDLSTPKTDGSFSVYNDVRDKLIAKGIPPEEIAFIHDANTEVRKKELFSKVRRGAVRILMGSTFKMGAGTNVQDLIIASHDLDCPWRPRDLEQRAGRTVRQGNKNPKVDIVRYVTEGTFDAYLYQIIENKQKFISQIMTSKSPARSVEDIDEVALSYAEIKALAVGNPYIKEKMDLDIQVSKLQLLKQSFLSQKYEMEDKAVRYFPNEIKQCEQRIADYESDIALAKENTPPDRETFPAMQIHDVVYTEKKEAGQAIIEACKAMKSAEAVLLGRYRGFPMKLSYDSFQKVFIISMYGKQVYHVPLGSDIHGNITRLDNKIQELPDKMLRWQDELENLKVQLENAKEEAQKEFPQEEELAEKVARLGELNVLLDMDKKDQVLLDDGEGVEIEPEQKKKERER